MTKEHEAKFENGVNKMRLMRTCPQCGEEVPLEEMTWTYRYGYHFKFVCFDCEEKINKESESMTFDPMYAGENLDDDY